MQLQSILKGMIASCKHKASNKPSIKITNRIDIPQQWKTQNKDGPLIQSIKQTCKA